MPAAIETQEIPLVAAAQRLGLSWQSAWSRVLTGALEGRQDPQSGRWYVSVESVERLKRERHPTAA